MGSSKGSANLRLLWCAVGLMALAILGLGCWIYQLSVQNIEHSQVEARLTTELSQVREKLPPPLQPTKAATQPAEPLWQPVPPLDEAAADALFEKSAIGSQNGMMWLAKHQEEDGHWNTVKYQARPNGQCDLAATGLAALAFLSAGHTDRRGPYKTNVSNAMSWIIEHQREDGFIAIKPEEGAACLNPGLVHAICTFALTECYCLAKTARIKIAGQKAVDYLVYRYSTGPQSDQPDWRAKKNLPDDMSVSVWVALALKSARVAGLPVPQEGFQAVANFLASVEDPAPLGSNASPDGHCHRYRYRPDSITAEPVPTMMGCLMWGLVNVDRPLDRKQDLQPAIHWVLNHTDPPGRWGNNGDRVDWVYWYCGTIAIYQSGGDDEWRGWDEQLRSSLADKQRKDGDEIGSFDTNGPQAIYGRVWSTALGTLCYHVRYRYAPIYGPP